MRLPKTAHTSRPWLIHGIAPDFHLEDVWVLFGTVYFAAIRPLRRLIVWPPLLRSIGQEWRACFLWAAASPPASAPEDGSGAAALRDAPHRMGRGAVGVHLSRSLALVLAPVLVRQGRLVRERTPILPEGAGQRSGIEPALPAARDTPPFELLVVGESTAAGVGVSTSARGWHASWPTNSHADAVTR